MYTEFFFRAELKEDTPIGVINFLNQWFNGEHIQLQIPEHEFFERDRWEALLAGGSAYFPGEPRSSFHKPYRQWEIGIHSNLKNYGQEIDYFLDWIDPYVHASRGTFLGYSLYEESDQPHLYWKRT